MDEVLGTCPAFTRITWAISEDQKTLKLDYLTILVKRSETHSRIFTALLPSLFNDPKIPYLRYNAGEEHGWAFNNYFLDYHLKSVKRSETAAFSPCFLHHCPLTQGPYIDCLVVWVKHLDMNATGLFVCCFQKWLACSETALPSLCFLQ